MYKLIKATFLSLAVTIFMVPLNANSTVVYDFLGYCATGCTGSVSGVLTLSDAYVPGDTIAESSDTGGLFISFDRYIDGVLDLSIDASDYAIVAGTADPFFGTTAGGDGLLPSTPGLYTLADIYIVDRAASVGLNDYTEAGGRFNTETVSGVDGFWMLRETAVPEPATLALIAFGLVGIVFARREKTV